MLRVGLSGGIGSGKSTVSKRFSERGAVVIDADALAREVVAPGSPGLDAIVDRFGEEVLDGDGALNRAALGVQVFADAEARRDLEAVTHPLIAERTAALVAAAPPDAIVVHDVPLLVEKAMGAAYHLVVVVGADERTRLHRLVRTRGMTEDAARSRMAAQATDAQRHRAADVWLDNDGTPAELIAAVDALWDERLVPFEANVRTGTRSHRPERLRLAAPDPTWAEQADRLLARLRRAFGDTVVTADHVGSTAVPGLVAKDVIDLQIGVRSLAALDDPDLVRRLRDAGFPRAEGEWADNAKDGTTWPKGFHGSADPGRVAHVHVREVGGPGWRWALMFRDWLRADAAARAEYAAEKQRLATTIDTVSEYADAKEPWFDAIHARAEHWATTTRWEPTGG